MKKLSLSLTCVAVALTIATSIAQAQGNGRHGNDELLPRGQQERQYRADQDGRNQNNHRQEPRIDHRSTPWADDGFDQRTERRNDRRAYYDARGPEFRRGGYIPRQYHGRTYVVNDYRRYNLPPPPRNHQWVQVGPDYVLTAIATGIIASIILNR
ncbi:MAG: RcnB family protein [Gallionella sp.]|nr:RcnB family protein [Gallionella sp.]